MLSHHQQLMDRLAAADREHQKEAGGVFVLRSIKYLCAFLLGAFTLDVILHLSAGWRLVLLLVLLGGALVLAGVGLYLGFVRCNRAEHIARLLEVRHPELGSRLINLLQLGAQTGDPALTPLTRELARQAVEDYAAALRGMPLEKLARTDALHRNLKRAATALLVFAAILAAAFRISFVELARFADPFGDHPPYSLTRLEIVQPGAAGTNIFYDKGVLVRVKAAGHQPRELFLTAIPAGRQGEPVTLPMFGKNGGGFDQVLDHIRGETLVFAHTRDGASASKQVRIGVRLTPQLEKLFVRITPPAYTGIPAEEKPYAFREVQALEGSGIRFRIFSNRPLREGALDLAEGDQPPRRVPLTRTAEQEVSGSFQAADSGRMRFSVTDTDGLPSDADCEGALTVTHDLPPSVRISVPDRDCLVAMDFKLEVQVEASDDYGVGEVRLHRGLNGVFSAPRVFACTNIVRDLRASCGFDLPDLGVEPGDVISVFAEALDNAPQPHLARSQTVRMSVISVEQYNDMVRQQSDIADAEAKYAELNEDLQSLIEQQRQLGEAMERLRKEAAAADGGKREALARQLDSLVARQSELNHKLNQHAARMETFVREQPLYDVEKDLQELLRAQAGVIRRSAGTNDAATLDIARRSSPPSGSRRVTPELLGELKRASDEQLERLAGAHRDEEQQVEDKLAEMDRMQELLNDFNLFETLFHAQEDLAGQSRAYNRQGSLDREDQLALKDLAADQKRISDMLGLLREKLNEDALAAQDLFPKAAQSGRDLAEEIGRRRLRPLADQSTDRMLSGDGPQSAALTERLRGEMEKMFSQCKGGNCPGGSELDNYLRLHRMNPGNTFAQMSRSRKFGLDPGRGKAGAKGEGTMGSSGYAMTDGSPVSVLGNESRAMRDSRSSRHPGREGRSAGAAAPATNGEPGKPDTLTGLNPVNRQSAAVSSESVMGEYDQVVESYFKTLTTRKEKKNDESNK
ncbi:MAG: hypothetical protein U1F98_04175 [Verrucomicrobiota bacterium]